MAKDDELIREFTRVRATPLRTFVEVRAANEQEDCLAERWTLAALLPPQSRPVDIDRALLRVLADYRYFRTCEICHERGHVSGFVADALDGKDHCQDCGEEAGED